MKKQVTEKLMFKNIHVGVNLFLGGIRKFTINAIQPQSRFLGIKDINQI